MEVTGDGKIPINNIEEGNQLATAILSVQMFLISAEMNLTVVGGQELLRSSKGSSVQHLDFQVPSVSGASPYFVPREVMMNSWVMFRSAYLPAPTKSVYSSCQKHK